MLITDKAKLKEFSSEYRIWQGIPGIEATKNGRIFASFYGGGTDEEPGNYCMLVKSEDGENFSEPIAVAYWEEGRCFDSCVWIDPLGRLWFIWSVMPRKGVYASICENPDAEELTWGDVFFIGHEIMLNKPTVLSSGEWLFPLAVWDMDAMRLPTALTYYDSDEETGAFVYRSTDNGVTFERLGSADAENRQFDEHMVLELKDGRLAMYIRTRYGIGVSYSDDKGKTWSACENSGLGGPGSRFHIRRLRSGRILLINHVNFHKRDHLTALLSEDEGKTWKYSLLLDERDNVSYPDVAEGEDGYLYITYDRERGAGLLSLDDVYAQAREILYAKITEQDIIAGQLVSEQSRVRCVISKLGTYAGEQAGLFDGKAMRKHEETADVLLQKYPNDIVNKIFTFFPINSSRMNKEESLRFDQLVAQMEAQPENKRTILIKLIILIRSVSNKETDNVSIADKVKAFLQNDTEITDQEIAEKLGVSVYYMQYQFHKETGMTVSDYCTANAKRGE